MERYDSIDGLRAYAAFCIVMMHVLANGTYELNGFLFEKVIPAFSSFVFLFMVISSFSVCCGYYESVSNGTITLNRFYAKRFARVWPFFALLTLADVIISPSVESVYEAFANLTLCFGLLPNPHISVIGVGWTLGVTFVFYLLFPFFCFLLSDRRRGWLILLAAIAYHWVCSEYFFDEAHMPQDFSGRTNILYCTVYFISGGMIYLYRDQVGNLAERFKIPMLMLIGVVSIFYFMLGDKTLILMILFSLILIYAIGRKTQKGLLNNQLTRFVGKYSMEVYLSHMVIFRILEKVKLLNLFSSKRLSYCMAVILTFSGALLFSVVLKWILKEGRLLLNLFLEKYNKGA